ncbi:hypothetical protein CBL_04847 [Carabus blaptoides fortunei]
MQTYYRGTTIGNVKRLRTARQFSVEYMSYKLQLHQPTVLSHCEGRNTLQKRTRLGRICLQANNLLKSNHIEALVWIMNFRRSTYADRKPITVPKEMESSVNPRPGQHTAAAGQNGKINRNAMTRYSTGWIKRNECKLLSKSASSYTSTKLNALN